MNMIARVVCAITFTALCILCATLVVASGYAAALTCAHGGTPQQVEQTWRCPDGSLAIAGGSVANMTPPSHGNGIGGGTPGINAAPPSGQLNSQKQLQRGGTGGVAP